MSATGEALPVSPDAGATLLEMLVVVALSAMIGALVFADFRPALGRLALERARTELAATLDDARARALRGGAAETVAFAEDGSGYSLDGRVTALPRGVSLRSDLRQVRFSPNGATDGGRVELARGARRLALWVAPGGVRLVEAP